MNAGERKLVISKLGTIVVCQRKEKEKDTGYGCKQQVKGLNSLKHTEIFRETKLEKFFFPGHRPLQFFY
jgi:hypothetical protein